MSSRKNILTYSTVQDFLQGVGGEDAIKLVGIVQKKKDVTDEVIGKKMKCLKVTEIRTILNRLHFKGIAFYKKTRDHRSGWYSYTWNIKNERIAELIIEEQAEALEKLERKIEYESEHEFFACKKECDNFAFEIAAEYHFKCPICGKSMDLIDNNKRLAKIKRNIKRISLEIEALKKRV